MFYVQDPICGELIDWEDAKSTIRFGGQRYYFCCLRCRNKFMVNPAACLSRERTKEASSDSGIPNPSPKGRVSR